MGSGQWTHGQAHKHAPEYSRPRRSGTDAGLRRTRSANWAGVGRGAPLADTAPGSPPTSVPTAAEEVERGPSLGLTLLPTTAGRLGVAAADPPADPRGPLVDMAGLERKCAGGGRRGGKRLALSRDCGRVMEGKKKTTTVVAFAHRLALKVALGFACLQRFVTSVLYSS